jgi:hypothetical protein
MGLTFVLEPMETLADATGIFSLIQYNYGNTGVGQ